MRSLIKMRKGEEFIKKYLNTPVKDISKEDALKRLKKCGILDSKGNVSAVYKDVIIRKEKK